MIRINNLVEQEKQKEHVKIICNQLVDTIEKEKDKVITCLLRYESYETAVDEITRSLDCLKNIDKELEDLSYGTVETICTFFPVNLPLYSLVIFAIVPGFMTNKMYVRPPILMKNVVQEISRILQLKKLAPEIIFIDMERSMFREAYVSVADVVLFTGKYSNAKKVQEVCPNALFIYNGAGINPVLVTPTASLNLAVNKTIEMRTFNSGQDCAGSDAILVHTKIFGDFLHQLLNKLQSIKVGEYSDRRVKVGPLVEKDQIKIAQEFLKQHENSLVYGGEIDSERDIVFPTVIVEKIRDVKRMNYTEFFAPIFYLLEYEDDDLKSYFDNPHYIDHAMYVSVFGETDEKPEIKNSVILGNKIVNDVERGNDAYGGYGPKANFASYEGIYHHRPILIAREMRNYFQYKNK